MALLSELGTKGRRGCATVAAIESDPPLEEGDQGRGAGRQKSIPLESRPMARSGSKWEEGAATHVCVPAHSFTTCQGWRLIVTGG